MVKTLVIGGGPAGVGLLMASRRGGLLQRLLADGLLIVERGDSIGYGDLGRYTIRSDSFAESFISAAAENITPDLRHLLKDGTGRQLAAHRREPVDLRIASSFLGDMGHALRSMLPTEMVATDTEAWEAHQMPDGSWVTLCRHNGGPVFEVRSQYLVLATGAEEAHDRLAIEPIAGIPLIPRHAGKTVLSSSLLGENGLAMIHERLKALHRPRVAIVGGSHSAMASAVRLLDQAAEIEFEPHAVALLHRNPLRITYASEAEAVADGFQAFTSDDICARTGRVFPLAGFRSDARQLLRSVLQLGEQPPEQRLRLITLDSYSCSEANHLLDEADLIISALGYRPRALPLFNHRGVRIRLASDMTSKPLVNGQSQVLDSCQLVVSGVFAMGLAAGYPLGGTHGEVSFHGQANGLALWQGEIGAQIARQLVSSR